MTQWYIIFFSMTCQNGCCVIHLERLSEQFDYFAPKFVRTIENILFFPLSMRQEECK
jgi:hypothetical protein